MHHRRKLAIDMITATQGARSQEQFEAIKSLILPWEMPTFTGDAYCDTIMRNHPMIGKKIQISKS